MLKIEFSTGDKKKEILLEKGEYYLGRDVSNDIIVKNSIVSRKHLKFYYKNDNWYIEDLGSTNGTIMATTPICKPYRINNNDKGLLGGDIIMVFKMNGDSPTHLTKIPVELDMRSEKTRDSNFITQIKKDLSHILSYSSVEEMIKEVKSYSKSIGIQAYGIFKKSKRKIDIIFSVNEIPSKSKLLRPRIEQNGEGVLLIEYLTDKKNNIFYYIKYNKVLINDDILYKFKAIMKIIYFAKIRDNTSFEYIINTDKRGVERELVAVSEKMKNVITKAIKYASLGTHILIRGENGTGKELIAELIKKESPRRNAPSETTFISGLDTGIIDSELFGHKKGSFTGAIANHVGVFERNNGGIVFIDEISLLPLRVQEKLLRTVEYGDIYPLGGLPKKVDVQIIFATNENIEKMIEEGRFRKDFYYRISAIEIEIPPLRERKEDIIPIFEYYMNKFTENYQKEYKGLENNVADMLINYPWEGNVRELRNFALIVSANFSSGDKVKIGDLPEKIIKYFAEQNENDTFDKKTILNIKKALTQKEKDMIKKALKITKGNKARAANLLGLSRSSFYKKLKQLLDS